jgi:two-component system, chemotaxis family, chemotaxis protein CheY
MTNVDMEALNILVIDDEAFIRTLIVRLLRDLGVKKIVEAGDGAEGLKKVTSQTDLVICDLEMPNMDGFEFVRQLRALDSIPNPTLPVLILSGHREEASVRGAINLGINGYLVKPVSKQALEAKIYKAVTSPMIDPSLLPKS